MRVVCISGVSSVSVGRRRRQRAKVSAGRSSRPSFVRHSIALSFLPQYLVELDYPSRRLGEARFTRYGNLGLAGFHAFVSGDDQRLGLGELLLARRLAPTIERALKVLQSSG